MPQAHAQAVLPAPGTMVRLSPAANPPVLKGLKVHPENPFRLEFVLDEGNDTSVIARAAGPKQSFLKQEANRLIKYFLASLTIPETDLWVNLSPYEKDRIVPDSFGQTEMGRDLLAQDYLLKQITASLIYPEDAVGKKFWQRVYAEAAEKFGTTQIPVNTFNKVWIVPEKAVVYENSKARTAYVVESKLKVMLEEDYLAVAHNGGQPGDTFRGKCPQAGCQANQPLDAKATQVNPLTTTQQVLRDIVLPKLEHEVNHGANFSQLRQVYHSLILATWYKKKIKDSILSQVYADKNKVAGLVSLRGSEATEAIYQKYLEAFKKGAYNYIKDEIDPVSQQPIPRKYFSGGAGFYKTGTITEIHPFPEAYSPIDSAMIVEADLTAAGTQDAAMKALDEVLHGLGHTDITEESVKTLVGNGHPLTVRTDYVTAKMVLALSESIATKNASFIDRIEHEVLPVLEKNRHPMTVVLPTMDDWLAYSIMGYHKEYLKRAISLGEMTGRPWASAALSSSNAHHTRFAFIDDDEEDIEAQAYLIKGFLGHLHNLFEALKQRKAEGRNEEAAQLEKEVKKYAGALINSLLIRSQYATIEGYLKHLAKHLDSDKVLREVIIESLKIFPRKMPRFLHFMAAHEEMSKVFEGIADSNNANATTITMPEILSGVISQEAAQYMDEAEEIARSFQHLGILESIFLTEQKYRQLREIFLDEPNYQEKVLDLQKVLRSGFVLALTQKELKAIEAHVEELVEKGYLTEDLLVTSKILGPQSEELSVGIRNVLKAAHSKLQQVETVAEHSWGVAFLLLILAPADIDLSRALAMALIHDLPEVETGDIIPGSALAVNKQVREIEAMESILDGIEYPQRFLNLLREYNAGETLEAKWVKSLDKLDLYLQALAYKKQDPEISVNQFVEIGPGRTLTLKLLDDLRNLATVAPVAQIMNEPANSVRIGKLLDFYKLKFEKQERTAAAPQIGFRKESQASRAWATAALTLLESQRGFNNKSYDAVSWAILEPLRSKGWDWKESDDFDVELNFLRQYLNPDAAMKSEKFHQIRVGTHHFVRVISAADWEHIKKSLSSEIQEERQGRYFRFLRVQEGDNKVIYVGSIVQPSVDEIDRDNGWRRRLEIGDVLTSMTKTWAPAVDFNQPEKRTRLTIEVVTNAFKYAFKEPVASADILEVFFRNTQKKFDAIASMYEQGAKEFDLKQYEATGYNNFSYSYLEHFSWIYWRQIRLIKDVLKRKPGRITVMDLGTGGANFILTAAHLLPKEDLSRVRFIGVDLGTRDNDIGRKMLGEIAGLDASIVLDRSPMFNQQLAAVRPDILIVNHVLEHLENPLEDYFHEWMANTKDIVSVTVPLGDELGSTISEHEHEFDLNKMREVAEVIKERESAYESIDDDVNLGGMWIFQRNIHAPPLDAAMNSYSGKGPSRRRVLQGIGALLFTPPIKVPAAITAAIAAPEASSVMSTATRLELIQGFYKSYSDELKRQALYSRKFDPLAYLVEYYKFAGEDQFLGEIITEKKVAEVESFFADQSNFEAVNADPAVRQMLRPYALSLMGGDFGNATEEQQQRILSNMIRGWFENVGLSKYLRTIRNGFVGFSQRVKTNPGYWKFADLYDDVLNRGVVALKESVPFQEYLRNYVEPKEASANQESPQAQAQRQRAEEWLEKQKEESRQEYRRKHQNIILYPLERWIAQAAADSSVTLRITGGFDVDTARGQLQIQKEGKVEVQDVQPAHVRDLLGRAGAVKLTPGEVKEVVFPQAIASDNVQARLDEVFQGKDSAMFGKGGIDLNADKVDLKVHNSGAEIRFKVDPAMLERLRQAPGLTPVILNIRSLPAGAAGVADLKAFLGLLN